MTLTRSDNQAIIAFIKNGSRRFPRQVAAQWSIPFEVAQRLIHQHAPKDGTHRLPLPKACVIPPNNNPTR